MKLSLYLEREQCARKQTLGSRQRWGICAPAGAAATASLADSRPVSSMMSRGKRDEVCDAPTHLRGSWSSGYAAGMCSSIADVCQ